MRLVDIPWKVKIPLAVTAAIVLTELVVAVTLVSRALRDARLDLETSSRNVVTVLGRSLREPLLRDHLWQAFEVVSTPIALRSADNPLMRIVVLDGNAEVFVSTDPRRIPVATAAEALPAGLAALAARSKTREGFEFLDRDIDGIPVLGASAPVEAEDGTKLGSVLLEFDAQIYRERLARTLINLALISVPGLLLLLPLGWVIGQRLAHPLEQLALAMSRVGHEPPSTIAARLPTTSLDEIGRLSAQAKLMLEGLARKQALEQEMVASERLAAVGRLTAAIAHEVNNPLGGMLNAIDTANRHGRPDALTRKTLGLLERGLLQIRSTVAALLVEARLNSPSLRANDWADLRLLIEPQLQQRSLQLAWHVAETAQEEIELPAHEVRQLVLNLLLNAAKAAQPWAGADATVELTATRSNGFLIVLVGNTGPPLTQEAQSRLFEPFQLPPDVDHATGSSRLGLGLWVCYQIAQRLGGRVDVQHDEGWTRFSVALPVVKTPSEPSNP